MLFVKKGCYLIKLDENVKYGFLLLMMKIKIIEENKNFTYYRMILPYGSTSMSKLIIKMKIYKYVSKLCYQRYLLFLNFDIL